MQVLEYRDVQQFSMEEVHRGHRIPLRLSGLAFHSALAVDGVEEVLEGEKLKVRVWLSLARKGLSGRFEFAVDVPVGVREVVFGDDGYPVWKARSP